MRKQKNRRFWGLGIVIVMAGMSVSGCGPQKSLAETAQKAVAVTTESVTRTTMAETVTVNGKVKPILEANISPKTSGKVSAIHFELGQRVNQGDILFQLDDKDLKLDLKQAEAALKAIRTALESSLVTAKTNYTDAQRNYQRMKRLFENKIASQQELEEAESEFKLAEDQYNSAKMADHEGETNARAQLAQAQTAYDIAKTQLEYAVIRAPISGVVASKELNVGQYVTSNTTVAGLADLSSVLVEANVPEGVVNRIRVGDQVKVNVKSILTQPVTGEVIAVAPATDTSTLNYPLKIKVANGKNLLKSGMFAESTLTLDRAKEVLVVPLAAVSREAGRSYVYLLEGDTAKRTLVQTGLSDSQWIEVTEGVSEKDLVIVKGREQLKDGSLVTIGK